MNLEKFYIPRHLDDKPKFLLWSMDEAMSFLAPLFLGIILSLGGWSLIIAIISYKSWKKIMGFGGTSLIKFVIYWHYPKTLLGLRRTPDSSIKNYIG